MSSRLECTSSRDTTNADEDGDELRYHVFLFVFVGRFVEHSRTNKRRSVNK